MLPLPQDGNTAALQNIFIPLRLTVLILDMAP
jgi:hypothetical protein